MAVLESEESLIVGAVAVRVLWGRALRHLPDSYFWSGVVVYWVILASVLALVAIIGTGIVGL